ncbi:MAG: hypothetical protein AABX25_05150 [Nanoarchaeota archaeon]
MEYFNERLGFLKHLLPDGYIAKSIADFLESKDTMPAPKTFSVINFLLNGKPRTSVTVDFLDVKLKSFEISGKKAGWTLSDDQHELVLYPLYPDCNPKEMGRYADGNYKMVRTLYVPAYKRLHLVRASGFQGLVNEEQSYTDLERRVLSGETVMVNRNFKVA